MNEKTVNVLELPKILARLAGYCTFSAGAELARDLRPTTDIYEAQLWQKETAEARLMFANQFNASLGGARDVREAAMAATRGVMIEAQVLLDIKNTLRRALTLKRTLGRMKGTYPLLSDHANEAEECAALQEEIGRVLDEGTGMVKDSASPQLATIRRDMKVAFDRLQTKLQRIIGSSTNQVLLQDALITMRNGRYVVPLKSEHKGKKYLKILLSGKPQNLILNLPTIQKTSLGDIIIGFDPKDLPFVIKQRKIFDLSPFYRKKDYCKMLNGKGFEYDIKTRSDFFIETYITPYI